jgi:A/G-specific adenine glycosylase
MELGALVCLPAAPRCDACPLADACYARRHGVQEKIPAPRAAPSIVNIDEVAVIVHRGPRVLIAQRPQSANRWAGLWEFPHAAIGDRTLDCPTLMRELTGVQVRMEGELHTIRHALTRHRICLRCFSARYISGRFRSTFYERGRWAEPGELPQYPFSSPQRELAKLVL